MKIIYKKIYPPMLFEEYGSPAWVWHATYKNVIMELGEGIKKGKPWVSIYNMFSSNPNKGECQEMIELLKRDFKGKTLFASVPMNEIAKHIFDKHKIKYTI